MTDLSIFLKTNGYEQKQSGYTLAVFKKCRNFALRNKTPSFLGLL